jgi:predicted RNase H-like HicB family nuclease
MKRAKIVGVVIEKGDAGLFHATSPDLRGLFVSGESIEEVKSAVPLVIEALFDAQGESVRVIEAEDHGKATPAPWVVLPKASVELAC